MNAEHQDLHKLITQLRNADACQSDKNDIVKLMGQFIRRSHLHFIYEETLFEKHAYPYAAAHKNDHRRFIQELDIIYLDFLACKTHCPVQIADQLSDLIDEHCHLFDADFAQYMADKANSTEYAIEL